MNLAASSTVDLTYYAPEFQIVVNGRELEADISNNILSLRITERIGEVSDFEFVVNDEFDLQTQQFRWLDHPLFEMGNSVSIDLGYVGNLQTMIDGKIKTLNSSFFSGDAPTLTVQGSDVSYDALVSRRSSPERTFDQVTYSEVAETLAQEAGLQANVDSTSERHERLVKRSGTNYYEFLSDLASRVNYEFYIVRRTLHFIRPRVETEPVVTLTWGKHLLSFSPSTHSGGLSTGVEVRGWNPATKEQVVGRANAGDEQTQESGRSKGSEIAQRLYGEATRVIYRPVTSTEEATQIAQSELNRASNQLVEGPGETFGIPELRPGVTIQLEGLGTRFSGKYYVKETTHTLDNNGYRTRFVVRRNAI